MVCSCSVLQAVNATGTLCDVAANGASRLTGWIGNVVKAERRNGTRHVQINNARLNDSQTICHIDLENLSHPRHLNHDALIYSECSAGQSCTCAARSERDLCTRQLPHYRCSLISRRREYDSPWTMFMMR